MFGPIKPAFTDVGVRWSPNRKVKRSHEMVQAEASRLGELSYSNVVIEVRLDILQNTVEEVTIKQALGESQRLTRRVDLHMILAQSTDQLDGERIGLQPPDDVSRRSSSMTALVTR